MPNPRAALPPGVYKIILHSYSSVPGEPNKPPGKPNEPPGKPGPEETVITCPPNKSGILYLDSYKEGKPEQLVFGFFVIRFWLVSDSEEFQWQIEGDGIMTSMSTPDAICYSDSPSFVRNPVSRWTPDKQCKWIISTRR